MTFEEDKKGFSEVWKSKWDMYQFHGVYGDIYFRRFVGLFNPTAVLIEQTSFGNVAQIIHVEGAAERRWRSCS